LIYRKNIAEVSVVLHPSKGANGETVRRGAVQKPRGLSARWLATGTGSKPGRFGVVH
jgi:hypothetical protein